jgi:hypothetical protein
MAPLSYLATIIARSPRSQAPAGDDSAHRLPGRQVDLKIRAQRPTSRTKVASLIQLRWRLVAYSRAS